VNREVEAIWGLADTSLSWYQSPRSDLLRDPPAV